MYFQKIPDLFSLRLFGINLVGFRCQVPSGMPDVKPQRWAVYIKQGWQICSQMIVRLVLEKSRNAKKTDLKKFHICHISSDTIWDQTDIPAIKPVHSRDVKVGIKIGSDWPQIGQR